MPDGFIGNASQKYLTNVNSAISSANAAIGRDPLAGTSYSNSPPPTITARSGGAAPYPPESAMGGSYRTGIGNHTNIVVSQSGYDEVIQMIRKADAEAAEDLYRIASQIEEMCETIYIVPATVPKYLDVVSKVKTSLDEFQSLTDQAVTQAYGFVSEIIRIDGR